MSIIKNYLFPFKDKAELHPGTSNSKRLREIRKRVHEIAHQMGYSDWNKIELGLCEFSSSPYAIAGNDQIFIPPMFLLNPSEIPSEFKGLNDNSLELQDPVFIDTFILWLNAELCLTDLTPQSLSTFQREQVILFLKTLQNPALYEKAREFVLAHEVAHICLRHIDEMVPFWNIIGRIKQVKHWKGHEKAADLLAIETLKEKNGALYLFTKFRDHFKTMRNKNFSQIKDRMIARFAFTDEGNERIGNSDHPNVSERMRYISQANIPFKLSF
ncbi:MAG: hypothetical protein JSR58_03455 [Verrucomicrobia bacterium]|nr:hypothetical protein [Verrucomicrobiota bacterium]